MVDFEKFYRSNYPRHLNLMRGLLKGDYEQAEDLVQESYTRAIMYKLSYDENRSSINTWFNSILFNVFKEFKKKGVIMVELWDVAEAPPKIPKDHSDTVLKEIGSIRNDSHKRVLELFYILGYSSKEISQILDVTQTNVTTISNRFKERWSSKYGSTI